MEELAPTVELEYQRRAVKSYIAAFRDAYQAGELDAGRPYKPNQPIACPICYARGATGDKLSPGSNEWVQQLAFCLDQTGLDVRFDRFGPAATGDLPDKKYFYSRAPVVIVIGTELLFRRDEDFHEKELDSTHVVNRELKVISGRDADDKAWDGVIGVWAQGHSIRKSFPAGLEVKVMSDFRDNKQFIRNFSDLVSAIFKIDRRNKEFMRILRITDRGLSELLAGITDTQRLRYQRRIERIAQREQQAVNRVKAMLELSDHSSSDTEESDDLASVGAFSRNEEFQELRFSQPSWPVINNFPTEDRNFFGREDELQILVQYLLPKSEQLDGFPLLLSGPGGMGKSRLVQRFVYLYGNYFEIVWNFHAEHDVVLDIRKLLEKMRLKGYAVSKKIFGNSESVLTEIKQTFEITGPVLLVFDNVLQMSSIQASLNMLDGLSNCKIIILSSQMKQSSKFKNLVLREMDPYSAKLLFKHCSGIDLENQARIVDKLGAYPLALIQAALVVKYQHITCRQYEARFISNDARAFGAGSSSLNYTGSVFFATNDVYAALKSDEEGDKLIQLLEATALFPPDRVEPFFLQVMLPFGADNINGLLAKLEKACLLEYSSDKKAYKIHRFIQSAVLSQIPSERLAELYRLSYNIFSYDVTAIRQVLRIDHYRHLYSVIKQKSLELTRIDTIFDREPLRVAVILCESYTFLRSYSHALEWGKVAEDFISESGWDVPDHEAFGERLNSSLGRTYYNNGELLKARKYFLRALVYPMKEERQIELKILLSQVYGVLGFYEAGLEYWDSASSEAMDRLGNSPENHVGIDIERSLFSLCAGGEFESTSFAHVSVADRMNQIEQLFDSDISLLVESLIKSSQVYFLASQFNAAHECVLLALKYCSMPSMMASMMAISANSCLAQIYWAQSMFRNHYETQLRVLELLEAYSKKNSSIEGMLADQNHVLAIACETLQNHDEAMRYYIKSAKQYAAMKDISSKLVCYINLAYMLFRKNGVLKSRYTIKLYGQIKRLTFTAGAKCLYKIAKQASLITLGGVISVFKCFQWLGKIFEVVFNDPKLANMVKKLLTYLESYAGSITNQGAKSIKQHASPGMLHYKLSDVNPNEKQSYIWSGFSSCADFSAIVPQKNIHKQHEKHREISMQVLGDFGLLKFSYSEVLLKKLRAGPQQFATRPQYVESVDSLLSLEGQGDARRYNNMTNLASRWDLLALETRAFGAEMN